LGATLAGNEDVSEYRHHGLEARATKNGGPDGIPKEMRTPAFSATRVLLEHRGLQGLATSGPYLLTESFLICSMIGR
jgi:hypothetical protein